MSNRPKQDLIDRRASAQLRSWGMRRVTRVIKQMNLLPRGSSRGQGAEVEPFSKGSSIGA